MNTLWKTILPVLFVCAGCAGSSTPAAQHDAGLTKDEARIDMGQADRIEAGDEAGAKDIVDLEEDVSLRDLDASDQCDDTVDGDSEVPLHEDVSVGDTDSSDNDADSVCRVIHGARPYCRIYDRPIGGVATGGDKEIADGRGKEDL